LTNNDILRRIRYIFDFSNPAMIEIFSHAEHNVSNSQVTGWLRKDDDDAFVKLRDTELAIFLNALINFKRGKREGEQKVPEERLNNNIIFQKLRIALNLKAEDIIDILDSVDFRLGKSELSAFFRNPDHKHFRECKDQILRNFLLGVQHKLRPEQA